jgi:hypothetical protein
MDVEMAATHIQDEDISMDDTAPAGEDIEFQLQHLREYENEKQLDLLRREIGHLIVHGIQPPEGWYDERFEHISLYSKLDWSGLATRFYKKDEFICQGALQINQLLTELLEDRATRPNFNINTYRRALYSIQSVWNYYKQLYMGDEQDTDILNLIEGIKFM